jgi:hypothetical protein
MPSFLPRGLLTDYLISQLTTAGLLVGDGEAPDAGGWDDDPNLPTSSYIPYVVLNPMAAAEPTGALGDTSTDFRVPYSVTSAGISRKQVETYADIGRKKITALSRVVIALGAEGNWKIQQARANSIGGVVRSDTVEPSEFTQSDVVIIYISKEH